MKQRKKRKVKLTSEERKQRQKERDHKNVVRSVFRNVGFDRVSEISEKELVFDGVVGELDDAFLYENLLVLIEYTTSQTKDIKSHLIKKCILFSKILSSKVEFVESLRSTFPTFGKRLGSVFHKDKYVLKIVYCSLNMPDETTKNLASDIVFFDYPVIKYFERISSLIKISCRDEVLEFMNVPTDEIATAGVFPKKGSAETYEGSVLPESSSGFPDGYKVVSFYADAAALLKRAYVLRRDGWRSGPQAYQRMLSGAKVEAIRKKLRADERVFLNNMVVTLPPDAQPEQSSGQTIDVTTLTKTEPVKVRLPLRANSIGVIDGQHRLFSYYESRNDDEQIRNLRNHRNLLVTGIIYPQDLENSEIERFEAGLFLTINANQTNAPSALRQEIEVLLKPTSTLSIGRQLIERMANTGPLNGEIQRYFYDKNKLKTSSIVSYGLGPLIKLSGEDSLFSVFSHPEKEVLLKGESDRVLETYLQFCLRAINQFLSAVKTNVSEDRWTTSKLPINRLLTVTYINAFLITLRILISNGKPMTFEFFSQRLKGIDEFDFKAYHSSQYRRMAEEIYRIHFSDIND